MMFISPEFKCSIYSLNSYFTINALKFYDKYKINKKYWEILYVVY